MRTKIITIIKKNPKMYRYVKKVYYVISKKSIKRKLSSNCISYCYVLNKEDQLQLIINSYQKIKKNNTKLLIIIDNEDLNIKMHYFIRNYLNMDFISLDYFKKYYKKMNLNNIVLFNNDNNLEIIDYI